MVIDYLTKLGIRVQNKNGEQRTICPECSHLRRKKKDRCLSVKIDADGAQFNCWHCGFHGGTFDEANRPRARLGGVGSKTKRTDFGADGRRLRYGVLP
jgi:hypothetical protein